MTRQKRSWTGEEVATALAMVQACGGSVEAASRECGVPGRTLYRWKAGPPARTGDIEKRQTARTRMVEAALPGARALLADKLYGPTNIPCIVTTGLRIEGQLRSEDEQKQGDDSLLH